MQEQTDNLNRSIHMKGIESITKTSKTESTRPRRVQWGILPKCEEDILPILYSIFQSVKEKE